MIASVALVASLAVACPPSGGAAQGPFVSTPEIAKAIYLAIRRGQGFGLGPQRNERVVVTDIGDHWEVYSTPLVRVHGRLVPLQGGGFGMNINRCSAAISHVGGIR